MIILNEDALMARLPNNKIIAVPDTKYTSNSNSIIDRIKYGNWKDRLGVGLGAGLLLGGMLVAPGAVKNIGNGIYGLGKLGVGLTAAGLKGLGAIGRGIKGTADYVVN